MEAWRCAITALLRSGCMRMRAGAVASMHSQVAGHAGAAQHCPAAGACPAARVPRALPAGTRAHSISVAQHGTDTLCCKSNGNLTVPFAVCTYHDKHAACNRPRRPRCVSSAGAEAQLSAQGWLSRGRQPWPSRPGGAAAGSAACTCAAAGRSQWCRRWSGGGSSGSGSCGCALLRSPCR